MLTNGVIIVNRLLSLSGQYKWKWKYHILLLKLCIDMFVFTNCPGLCLGHSVSPKVPNIWLTKQKGKRPCRFSVASQILLSCIYLLILSPSPFKVFLN